jgi:hypothetical protein
MTQQRKALGELQQWFAAHCDGEWEHGSGVEIYSLDNPGWSIRIDLGGTELEDQSFTRVERDDGDGGWISCWREGSAFHGASGPSNLDDLARVFIDWATGA